MEERLISRFGWGLTVAVEPPELEMRVAILLKKALLENIVLDENVAFFIAKHIRSNVRELEGALKRVLAYSRFTGHALSLDLAREALKDLLAVQNRQISIENIQKTVADYYKIKVAEMYSKKRSRIVARPRQMAMAISKELTPLSLPDIGEAFGGQGPYDRTAWLSENSRIARFRSGDQSGFQYITAYSPRLITTIEMRLIMQDGLGITRCFRLNTNSAHKLSTGNTISIQRWKIDS